MLWPLCLLSGRRRGGSLPRGPLGLDPPPVLPRLRPTCCEGSHSGGSVVPLGGLRWPRSLAVIIVCGEGHGRTLQRSYLENPMDKGLDGLQPMGVAKSQTRLTHTLSCKR